MNAVRPVFLLILLAFHPMPVRAEDETSVAEPTRLAVMASQFGARITTIGDTQRIASNDAAGAISVIEVSAGAQRELGLRIDLRNEGEADSLYLDAQQARWLHAEFQHLGEWSERACDRGTNCSFGIARCRPSQTVTQAFCPATYTTSEGSWGIAIETQSGGFRFPGVDAAQWSDALAAALKSLEQPES